MRTLILVTALVALVAWPSRALATCTTHTFIVGGVVTVCTTCCTGSVCQTVCS